MNSLKSAWVNSLISAYFKGLQWQSFWGKEQHIQGKLWDV